MKKYLVALLFLAVLYLPAIAGAAPLENVVRLGEDTEVPAGTTIVGNVVLVNGNATVRGRVRENVVVIMGDIYLEEEAVVDGNVVAVGGRVVKSPTAQVGGENVSLGAGNFRFMPHMQFTYARRVGAGSWWRLLSIMFLGWVLFWLLPAPVVKVADVAGADPLKSVLYGLLAYLAVIPLSVMLLITIVGIPVIPLFWAAVFAARFLGQVALGLLAGKFIAERLNKSWSDAAYVLLGLLTLGLLTLIPVVGSLVSLFYGLLGFGAVVRGGRQCLNGLRRSS